MVTRMGGFKIQDERTYIRFGLNTNGKVFDTYLNQLETVLTFERIKIAS